MLKDEDLNDNALQNLYIDLNKACTVTDNDRALRISVKILDKYPDEFKAFHCKIVALMQLERFEDALKSVNKSQFVKELVFEKAYSEYRLNRLEEAVLTIKSADENDMRVQELLGQILYKQEYYEEAQEKYKFLVRNINNAYEDERIVNMTASVTALSQWLNKKKEFPKVNETMFEISFNKACYLAANGEYEEAIKKLNEAEKICVETFEGDQDLTPAEIDEELSAIKIQRAFCLQKLNRMQEANNIYHDVLKKRSADSHILAVAANNVVCINRDQNIFDSKKKIKIATSESLKQKLVSYQKERIETNHFLFQFHSNQGDSVKTQTSQFLIDRPNNVKVALIKTAQLVKEKQVSLAIKFLQEYLEMVEKTDISDEDLVSVQLTLAQLHIVQGSVSRCNEILSDLPINFQYKFGVISTRVTLFMLTEDVQSAIDCLEAAVEWYRSESAALKKGPAKDALLDKYDAILKTTANFCVRNKRPELGAKHYEQLLQRNPNCQSILASLIAAYSRFDKEKAEKTSMLLKDDTNIPEVDVDSLESAFIFGAKHMKKLLKGEATPNKPNSDKIAPSRSNDATRHKKKKKTKLPKNYDPKKLPDPERWLPKRERAHYKGRKRDKRANISRGPQGATGGVTDSLDASKKPSAPTTPAAEPIKKVVQPAAAAASTSSSASSKAKAKNKSKKKLKW